MRPGTQLILEGAVDGVPHRVVFTVTDLMKNIDGVNALVIWDTDESEGELVESELSFFAQDDDENVWNLGEYPEEFVEHYPDLKGLVKILPPTSLIPSLKPS